MSQLCKQQSPPAVSQLPIGCFGDRGFGDDPFDESILLTISI